MTLDLSFLLTQSINLILLCLIQYGNGLLVIHKNIKVNYTRKINHFALFFIPIYLNRGYAYDESYGLFILGAFMAVLKFVFYIEPIRERISFINVMFHSFDRPEDRPHTLLWIATQTAIGHIVLISMGVFFAQRGLLHLILIPILIYGIGDGLAEPVGVRFGKHKYMVHALFTDKKYYRTLEGSACVYAVSLIIIAAQFTHFTLVQFIVAMAFIPLVMTLAEAFSPHTWDSPFMFFFGYLALFIVVAI